MTGICECSRGRLFGGGLAASGAFIREPWRPGEKATLLRIGLNYDTSCMKAHVVKGKSWCSFFS